jgi:hypothetical protein
MARRVGGTAMRSIFAALGFIIFWLLAIEPSVAEIPFEVQSKLERSISALQSNRKSRDALGRLLAVEETIGQKIDALLSEGAYNSNDDIWPTVEMIGNIHGALDGTASEELVAKWRDRWLLSAAQRGGLAGDYLSVAWFYLLLSDAQFRAPKIFNRALDILDKRGEADCSKGLPQSTCELNIGGNALRNIGAPVSGLLLQEAGIQRLKQNRELVDRDVQRLYIANAVGWWQSGLSTRAQQQLNEVTRNWSEIREGLDAEHTAAYFALRSAICESELQFRCASDAFSSATMALSESKPSGNALGTAYAAEAILRRIAINQLTQLSCLECPHDLQEPVRAYLNVLADWEQPRASADLARSYLLARLASQDPKSKTISAALARKVVERSEDLGRKEVLKHQNLTRKNADHQQAVSLALLELSRAVSGESSSQELSNLLTAGSFDDASRMAKAAFANFGEIGFFSRADLVALSDVALFLEALGKPVAAAATRQYLWNIFQAEFVQVRGSISTGTRAALASILAPAFSALAESLIEHRRWTAALSVLVEVELLITAKYELEASLSGARAVAALRSLRESSTRASGLFIKLSKDARRTKRDELIRSAFKLSQMATLTDTAAALRLARQNKELERFGLERVAAVRLRLRTEVELAKAMRSEFGLGSPLGAEAFNKQAQARLKPIDARIDAVSAREGSLVGNTAPRSASELSGALTPGETLILIQSGQRGTNVFTLSNHDLRANHAAVEWDTLYLQVQFIRSGLRIRRGKFSTFPVAEALDLFRRLFGSLAPQITGSGAIAVYTSGPIESLPLGILPVKDDGIASITGDSARAAKISWLARTAAIRRLASLYTVRRTRTSKSQPAAGSFLGIGNPLLAPAERANRSPDVSDAPIRGTLADGSWLRSLASLPETETELREIAVALGQGPQELFVRDQATETNVKRTKLSSYSIIAFATHGVVAGLAYHGSEPGLVLTPPPLATRHDDGYLSMSEIMDLNLDADLVVLSACDTATSDGRPLADSLSGLARAFFSAGARNVIATHWAIPSLPAVEVTTRTMAQDETLTFASRLLISKRDLMDRVGPSNFAHPASWGAFEIISSF